MSSWTVSTALAEPPPLIRSQQTRFTAAECILTIDSV